MPTADEWRAAAASALTNVTQPVDDQPPLLDGSFDDTWVTACSTYALACLAMADHLANIEAADEAFHRLTQLSGGEP